MTTSVVYVSKRAGTDTFDVNVTSSVRSSSDHHGLLHTKATFFKFGAILPIYIHNSLSLSFSVQYTEQNQAILLHELH